MHLTAVVARRVRCNVVTFTPIGRVHSRASTSAPSCKAANATCLVEDRLPTHTAAWCCGARPTQRCTQTDAVPAPQIHGCELLVDEPVSVHVLWRVAGRRGELHVKADGTNGGMLHHAHVRKPHRLGHPAVWSIATEVVDDNIRELEIDANTVSNAWRKGWRRRWRQTRWRWR